MKYTVGEHGLTRLHTIIHLLDNEYTCAHKSKINIKNGLSIYGISIIVIAIGDDYRFAFFGLVTKLWLKFQGLFY